MLNLILTINFNLFIIESIFMPFSSSMSTISQKARHERRAIFYFQTWCFGKWQGTGQERDCDENGRIHVVQNRNGK